MSEPGSRPSRCRLLRHRCRNFQVTFADDSGVVCTMTKLESAERQPLTTIDTYSVAIKLDESLLDWVRGNIDTALTA